MSGRPIDDGSNGGSSSSSSSRSSATARASAHRSIPRAAAAAGVVPGVDRITLDFAFVIRLNAAGVIQAYVINRAPIPIADASQGQHSSAWGMLARIAIRIINGPSDYPRGTVVWYRDCISRLVAHIDRISVLGHGGITTDGEMPLIDKLQQRLNAAFSELQQNSPAGDSILDDVSEGYLQQKLVEAIRQHPGVDLAVELPKLIGPGRVRAYLRDTALGQRLTPSLIRTIQAEELRSETSQFGDRYRVRALSMQRLFESVAEISLRFCNKLPFITFRNMPNQALVRHRNQRDVESVQLAALDRRYGVGSGSSFGRLRAAKQRVTLNEGLIAQLRTEIATGVGRARGKEAQIVTLTRANQVAVSAQHGVLRAELIEIVYGLLDFPKCRKGMLKMDEQFEMQLRNLPKDTAHFSTRMLALPYTGNRDNRLVSFVRVLSQHLHLFFSGYTEAIGESLVGLVEQEGDRDAAAAAAGDGRAVVWDMDAQGASAAGIPEGFKQHIIRPLLQKLAADWGFGGEKHWGKPEGEKKLMDKLLLCVVHLLEHQVRGGQRLGIRQMLRNRGLSGLVLGEAPPPVVRAASVECVLALPRHAAVVATSSATTTTASSVVRDAPIECALVLPQHAAAVVTSSTTTTTASSVDADSGPMRPLVVKRMRKPDNGNEDDNPADDNGSTATAAVAVPATTHSPSLLQVSMFGGGNQRQRTPQNSSESSQPEDAMPAMGQNRR